MIYYNMIAHIFFRNLPLEGIVKSYSKRKDAKDSKLLSRKFFI